MALDPDLARLLPVLETQEVVRYADSPIGQARAAHDHSVARLTPPARRTAVAQVFDTDVPGTAGPVPVRVYRPRQTPPVAVVLWLHGGGWCTGSLDTADVVARELCDGLPAVVVSVDYRLAPEHPWPAATDDALSALRWVIDSASDFGADPASVVVGGDSAGGNIAAAIVQQARADGLAIAAQLLVYPALDLDVGRTEQYPSLQEFAEGYALPPENLRIAVEQYVSAGADLADPRISPIRQQDLTGLPPTVISVAEYDPVRDHGRVYADALREASVPVVLHGGHGLIHGSFDLIGSAPGIRGELACVLTSLRQLLAGAHVEETAS
ncbi:MAG: alpha/beta hydrolase [Actinomycetales bacterium]